MEIIIYHNAKCRTSRNTLTFIRDAGFEPTIIEYLKHPFSDNDLIQLIKNAGLNPRDVIRQKEAIYSELGLDKLEMKNKTQHIEDKLIDAMVKHPILINRPFVVTSKGTRLCRPAEIVKEIL